MTTRVLWTSEAAEMATGGRSSRPWKATGVSIDTRTLREGDLFVALQGPNFDGHDFAAEAFERGAAAAVVRRTPKGVASAAPILVVEDTLEALTALARTARARFTGRVVAVTGSVGKTSVKEALRLVLAEQGPTEASYGNLNNQIGVPLSLARLPPGCAYAIFELGMSRPGELSQLARLVRPHTAVITTIAPAHTAFFDSIGAIADAKAEIFDGMSGGTAVLNRDNAYFATLAVAAFARGLDRIMGFGAHPDAVVRLVGTKADTTSSRVEADVEGTRLTYRVGLPGRHWVTNSLAVLAAVRAVDADVAAAAKALAGLTALKGRGKRHFIPFGEGTVELIDDSYNASPASVRAAIDSLGASQPGPGGRRIAALGDMLELGAASPRMHAGLAAPLVAAGIDLVFTAGAEMAHLHRALPEAARGGHAASAEDLVPILLAALRPGDVVVVKGSLGSRMTRVVAALLASGEPPVKAVNG